MKYTSAEAAKLLRQLNEERDNLLYAESQARTFVAATTEELDSVRPAYDYAAVGEALETVEKKIRRVKHAINVFNTTHKVPGFDMTIDEVLVYIPQLTQKKSKLSQMASVLPKTRERTLGQSAVIDYRYANYDVEQAAADLKTVSALLANVQTALDVLNNTETMEIDL